jgi:hypothetical protein
VLVDLLTALKKYSINRLNRLDVLLEDTPGGTYGYPLINPEGHLEVPLEYNRRGYSLGHHGLLGDAHEGLFERHPV